MREPGPAFAAIDAEAFQPLLDVRGQQRRVPVAVLEDEHAHAPRLAIPARCEPDLPRPGRGVAQSAHDRADLAGGPIPEECERDVQVPPGDETNAFELGTLPTPDGVEDVVG